MLYFLNLISFLCILASVADAAAVNPKGMNTLLTNGLITSSFNGNPVFSNGQVIYQEILLIVSSLIMEFSIT